MKIFSGWEGKRLNQKHFNFPFQHFKLSKREIWGFLFDAKLEIVENSTHHRYRWTGPDVVSDYHSHASHVVLIDWYASHRVVHVCPFAVKWLHSITLTEPLNLTHHLKIKLKSAHCEEENLSGRYIRLRVSFDFICIILRLTVVSHNVDILTH